MAVEQVARWPWNAWPDESGLGGRMAWNPHPGCVAVVSGFNFKSINSESTRIGIRNRAGELILQF